MTHMLKAWMKLAKWMKHIPTSFDVTLHWD
jgi:hypothetical protein